MLILLIHKKNFDKIRNYLKNTESDKSKEIENIESKFNNSDSIFISYDRITKCKKNGFSSSLSFLAVLFHELAHAFMDNKTGKSLKNKYFEDVIEESLADALAYNCFVSTMHQSEASSFIFMDGKALRYHGSYYLSEIGKTRPIIDFARMWKDKDIKGIFSQLILRIPELFFDPDYFEFIYRFYYRWSHRFLEELTSDELIDFFGAYILYYSFYGI